MKFASLEEYFYKLQNMLLLFLLAPLLSFIYLFIGPLEEFDSLGDVRSLVIGLVAIIAAVDWLIMSIIFKRMVDKIGQQVGLSLKLERYFYATLIRYGVGVITCLILAAGFYLTNSSVFTGLFGVAIILFFVHWPRPAKVCRDLKLKGDEKEMVLYKKHSL